MSPATESTNFPPKPLRSRLVIGAFFALLWILFAGTWLGWGQFSSTDENRKFAPAPRLDENFGTDLNHYLHDHFGFRGWFITLNSVLRAYALRTSTTPKVAIGRAGFLYYMGEGSLENYMGTSSMTDCEIESWLELFNRRAAWMKEQHIPYLVVMAPDKQTIYPEFMPEGIPHSTRPSRADLFAQAIRARTDLPFVDMRGALAASKQVHPVFYSTDTHWSQWGAFSGYREILKEVARRWPDLAARLGAVLEPSQLLEGAVTQPGDLNRLLGLGRIAPERKPTYEPPGGKMAAFGVDDALIVGGNGNPSSPVMVMFRDSFGSALVPFLGFHFSRVFAPMTYSFDPPVIARERPALVISELVERRLNEAPPYDPVTAMRPAAEMAVVPRIWGIVDEPVQGANLPEAEVRVSGWALADQPNAVQQIEVLIDGRPAGSMRLHLPNAGVELVQPGMRDSHAAGIEFHLNPRSLTNGRHRMTLRATDTADHIADIDSRSFCVAH